MQTTSALNTQIGGDHYKHLAIQPVVYSHKNQLGFLAGCVIKRICRYNQPTGKGKQDLEKAAHELQLLIEFNEVDFDEPSHALFFPVNLPISPARFCTENHLSDWQARVVHLVTRYNRDRGRFLVDLHEAARTVYNVIDTTCPF